MPRNSLSVSTWLLMLLCGFIAALAQPGPQFVRSPKGFLVPVARIGGPAPASAAEQKTRFRRDAHFRQGRTFQGEKPGSFEDPGVNSPLSPVHPVFVHTVRREGIPAAEVPLIIVGQLSSARGFVTSDFTGIYSEFGVHVLQVLKSPTGSSIKAGSAVIGLRPGGAVQFPSGRTDQYLYAGEGIPHPGSTYLMFLSALPDDDAYGIYTAYEFKDDLVIAVDDEPQFSAYARMSKDRFLELVRAQLASHEKRK